MSRNSNCPATQLALILASASPRRAEILRNAGFAFTVQSAQVDETLLPNERPEDYVLRLAQTKAEAVASGISKAPQSAFVLGADTTVVCEGRIFGKPSDAAEARSILRALSGTTHEVHTGIAIVRTRDAERVTAIDTTRVTFAELSPEEIDAYVATGEPFDKAGAYAIQGLAGKFVSRIEGCYFNVMGLPLSRVRHMLQSLGFPATRHGKLSLDRKTITSSS